MTFYCQQLIIWNDINVIFFNKDIVLGLHNFHVGMFGNKFNQQAFIVSGKMLNYNKGKFPLEGMLSKNS